MNDQERLQKLQESVDAPPFHRFLKMRVESIDTEKGVVVMRLPFQPAFARSAKAPQIHGGVSAAFIDIAGDYALVALLGHGVPTINLRIDYLRMAENTDLIATACVVKAGRSIGVVDIEVRDESNRVIAVGRGNYSTRVG